MPSPKMGSRMKIERYGIYWADLNPVRGAEIAKIRPVVIISDDLMNQLLKTVVVCPLTSTIHPGWRSRLAVRCGGREAEVAVDQIRTIDKSRITGKIDSLDASNAETLRALIFEMFGQA